ncbi:TonB-dependent receptor [Halosquirtibacter laminarini]|uniref:TonB-dependent receptor n=1 Tax=Halosquirtibacter laminarini TaxID=3374600 RepID=A0AC61NDP7_9BACT|nr:TonB-dependent receptor [Prolixibacteraceae bacterium]
MRHQNRRFILLLFVFILHFPLLAQIKISGIVLDKKNQTTIPFSTVRVMDKNANFLSGGITNENGQFSISIKKEGDISITINTLGYKKNTQSLFVSKKNPNYYIGKIYLEQDIQQLDAVSVVASKDGQSNGLQKKSYKLDQNISQSGGSVLKAMQNLPGVSIDGDGTVSLRGSKNVLVLVDGHQSSLTGFGTATNLDAISSSNIEKIEIINNPSSKYDSKGNAGIINIVYKKEIKKGFNGEVSLSTGVGELTNSPQNIAGISIQDKYRFTPKVTPSILLNYRSEKINYFIQADATARKKINSNIFSQRIYDNGDITDQQFSEMREQLFYNVKFGVDWFIDQQNKITVYGLWEDEYHVDHGDVPYIYNSAGKDNRLWEWTENEDTKFLNIAALYHHDFEQKGHTLDIAYHGTGGREDELFPFSDSFYNADGIQQGATKNDSTHLIVSEYIHNITLDYVKPTSSGRFETGVFLNLRNIPITYDIYSGDPSTGYMDPNLGDWSDYTENVLAAYINYVYIHKKLDLEVGGRFEQSWVDYQLSDDNIYYNDNYPTNYFNFYPNLRLTYHILENHKVSFFANKRIDRPDEFQLRPFPKYDDPEILRTGNPALQPQYTTNFELAYKYDWKGGAMTVSAYHKKIEDIIGRVAIQDPNRTNVINYVPDNFGDGTNQGIEWVFNQKITSFFTLDANLNWYVNTIGATDGTIYYPDPNGIDYHIDKQTNNTYNFKINGNFDLKHGVQMQMSYIYYAPDIRPQSEISSHQRFNFGISKAIMKGQGEVFVNANDLFNTDKIETTTYGQGFTMTQKDYLETQTIMLGVKFKF